MNVINETKDLQAEYTVGELYLDFVSSGQWAGPLDLYGKEDAPALHESPSYG